MNRPQVPQIFSRKRRAARRARHLALRAADPQAQFLRDHMAAEIVERLDFMRLTPALALVLDDVPDPLASLLVQRGSTVSNMALPDEELPYPQGGFDLIASLAQLDTVNDLPGALIHARAALAPGGLFIACLCGAGSLPVLRQIMLAADGERPAARIHPQIDNLAASGLMGRAGFSRQVVDSHSLTVSYRSLERMLADLRAQGLTNVLADAPPPLTREGMARARAAFADMADSEGRVTETFEILTLTGWR